MEAPFPHAGELAALGTAVCWTAALGLVLSKFGMGSYDAFAASPML